MLRILTIIIINRPRHTQLIADIRHTGARIGLIGDGRCSAAIAVAVRGNGVHAVMGMGGAPRRCACRRRYALPPARWSDVSLSNTPELEEAHRKNGHQIPSAFILPGDLAIGSHIIFAACGITDGALLRGVRFFGEGYRTHLGHSLQHKLCSLCRCRRMIYNLDRAVSASTKAV